MTHPRIVVDEKGKKVTFLNNSRNEVQRVKIDGCMIKEGPRADWIVSEEGAGSVIVELKGRDVEHAVDQLFATVDHPKCRDWLSKPTKMLVVCAKYPAFDTKVAKAQVRAKKLGLSLKVICKRFECRIAEL